MDGDNIVSSGGRVLCATAMGADTKDAQANAYNAFFHRLQMASHRTGVSQ
jgi:phosphoribosylamine-glycine ligase